MHCSITVGIIPIVLRLPRGLALLFLVSLLWQTVQSSPASVRPELPPLPLSSVAWHRRRRRRRATSRTHPPEAWPFLWNSVPRLLGREILLIVLLRTSGGLPLFPLQASVLALPLGQTLLVGWRRRPLASAQGERLRVWTSRLQRLYQLVLVFLFLSTLVQLLGSVHRASTGLVFPIFLGTWVTHPDDETEVRITTPQENRYTITLRGTFTLLWEPRDGFEKWMLILFLRRLHRPGQTSPLLSQRQVGEAFGSDQSYVSRWERLVQADSWHVLSDRFRHALHSLLPDTALSRSILATWVPAFWLSAWDVRERLIQLGILANRDALDVEALHALAQHTGFSRVRDVLLERFNLQGGQLIAKETWWLKELVGLNERLIAKLERGEQLTPPELADLEPLRLKTPAKQGDSDASAAEDPAGTPLVAALKGLLFESPPQTTPDAPVCCTYCGSDDTAPKSKAPRLKKVIDELGAVHFVPVLRHYCHNLACRYQSFTHLPAGLVPHSPYPVQVRLLAVELYEVLLSTYRRSARMFNVKAATVYHWMASLSPAAVCLAAYLGVVRTSGVVGIDDKWILVCSPSAVRPHGHRSRAVWRYAYFAIDVYSYDLLALELYPEHNDEAVRLILLELKAKGIRPRVVVSDLDPAYGRILPQVFPNAIHHECIFHAIQNALRQMTTVYGRYYLEKVPETAPLHEAITHLFRAQTQTTVRKRFAELMDLRSSYVTRTPAIACVFDSLERHFPKLVNAIESPDIPRTNNSTELVIRRFDQHYQSMCGLDSLESAQVYLRLFELVYRLTPFADDGRAAIRGKSPLELAGYDLKALPIANFFINLKLPPLALLAPEVVPME